MKALLLLLFNFYFFLSVNAQINEHREIKEITLTPKQFSKTIIYHSATADYYFDAEDFLNDPEIINKKAIIRALTKTDELLINPYMRKRNMFTEGVILFIARKIKEDAIAIEDKNGLFAETIRLVITEKWISATSTTTYVFVANNIELFSYSSTPGIKGLPTK